MLPRLYRLLPALVIALLIVLGTLGIYSAEASTFRSTMREAQVYGQMTMTEATDFDTDGVPMISSPGQPY